MQTKIRLEELNTLVEGQHGDPFSLLGPHAVEEGSRRAVSVRAFLPHCAQAWVVDPTDSRPRPMRKLHPAGFFEGICSHTDDGSTPQYHLQLTHQDGRQCTMHDPYRFPSLFTDYDLHLFGEGKHYDAYNRFGAQLRTVDGISGVNFAVWAPNAQAVSVVGDFNEWDGRRHPMRKLIPSGVWELFIPELGEGEIYKFRIKSAAGVCEKSDPYGFAAELPPRTASRVANLDAHAWQDDAWMEARRESNPLEQPVSIYEVHLGSWQRSSDAPHWLNYRELAHRLVAYCQEMNYTHVELMPITEHPFTGSWGYQTVGYFAATSRYGTPEDFMYFVDHCHRHGIGVILDWVPAHFPRDGHGLIQFDGTPLFEHADARQGEHPDWGTMIFNYGRCEVRNFLLANALFWLDKYHIDGLRVDAVASMIYLDYSREEGEWVPNEHGGRENLEAISLLKEFNEEVHLRHPGSMTIAEESTAWTGVSRPTYLGGLGFSLKWNMGWMNDTLEYMHHEPIHRKYHHDELTFSLIYAFTENFCLPLSHDEVVHGKGSLLDKMPGDTWQKFANLRMLYSYMWTHPGKKLLFMGGEFGQWNEWDCDSDMQWDLLQWDQHRGLKQCVADLNRLYIQEPSLHENDFDESGFEWVDCHNHEDSTLSYLRRAKHSNEFVLVVCNFTPVTRKNHRLGVPEGGWYDELFCSDSEFYAGSNTGNGPGVMAAEQESHGRPFSIEIDLPPLGVLILKPRR